jgi:hypothetical protein
MSTSSQTEISEDTFNYNNGSTLKAQVVPLWSLATAVIVLRCWIRLRGKTLGKDDYFMGFAGVSSSFLNFPRLTG